MTREDIDLLFEYDRWANQRALQAAALTAAQSTRDLGGALRDVHVFLSEGRAGAGPASRG
ncbi:MAG TPA: hypothetical protein VFA60_02085 [Terriglobales bacterium]|nr:hypothetical protein [Terriglobales bacterium]